MTNPLTSFVYTLYKKLLRLGVTPDMEFLERKKIEVINLVMAFNVPVIAFFMVLNLNNGEYFLASLNLLSVLGNILILVLHYHGRIREVRLIISFSFILIFTLQSILFRNGTEYFLYTNLIITLIFYNNKRFIYWMALLNCAAFVGIKLVLNSSFYFASVPDSRVFANTALSVGMSALCLLYFKYQQNALLLQIREKNTELEAMNKNKEKLFSIVAHDLRSPVAQLKSALDLLNREYISPDEFREMTGKLTRQIDDMQLNLNDLLVWSRSQMAGIVPSPEKVPVRTVVEEIIALKTPLANAKNIRFNNLADEIYVWIDPDHLKLALRNILSNAIKFSYENGLIEISTTTSATEAVIAIKDFGVGMTREEIDRLFSDSFYSTKGTAQEKGTGLGLKLCREFLQKSNASLSVTSQKNAGSTFFITTPAPGPLRA
ncbi:MAG TPA: HAMP domain-containing sensor histidine kinase [Sediminibacterium sp.]|nr:HAMP domain-containing sensor histidine kinase [Sediminibacterium sp.]